MKVNLQGQVALVTGAGRGIGEQIAHTLAANGARVIYADIDVPAARKAAAASPNGIPLRMDVTSEEEVKSGIAQVARDQGRLDILVNNAGVNSPLEYRVNIDRFPLAEWQRILAVDLNGLFLASRAAAEVMIPRRSGRIINISSVLGVVPARLQCAYTTAKGGVVTLTRTMAIELGASGILVNCIAPGTMQNTAFHGAGGALSASAQRLLDHVPLGRPGKFGDIAQAALFFADPDSSYVTGQILCVDGGWSSGGFFRDF